MPATQSTQSKSDWQALYFPKQPNSGLHNPIAIHDSEFIAQDNLHPQRLHNFNIVDNVWKSIPITARETHGWTMTAYNKRSDLLYLCAGRKLKTLNLKTETTRVYGRVLPITVAYGHVPPVLLIGDDLHVFGFDGIRCAHYVLRKQLNYNRDQNPIQYLPDGFLNCHSIAYSESRNCIFALDRDADPDKRFAEYSLETGRWRIMQMPVCFMKISDNAQTVCSADGRYLITFGGQRTVSVYGRERDFIFVYDLNDRASWPRRSTIRCPGFGEFHVLIMTDKKREEIATFGYVRDCFGKEELNGVQFPPHYIIQMMAKWVEMEWVYLMYKEHWGNWKISLQDIIESLI